MINQKLEQFIQKANIIHNNRYDYSLVEYKNIHTKVKIICKQHGVFEQLPTNHIHSKQNCPFCKKNRLNTEKFIKKSNIKHNSKYDYSLVNYVNSTSKVKIICLKHGEFLQVASDHLKGSGCPRCNSSKGEIFIRNWLNEHNIIFREQFRFKDCRNKRPLPFDFWLPEHNCCIEFDGQQHFQPYSFNSNKSVNISNKNLEKTQLHDIIKNNFCAEQKINLIRISYLQIRNIDKILLNYFLKCGLASICF